MYLVCPQPEKRRISAKNDKQVFMPRMGFSGSLHNPVLVSGEGFLLRLLLFPIEFGSVEKRRKIDLSGTVHMGFGTATGIERYMVQDVDPDVR